MKLAKGPGSVRPAATQPRGAAKRLVGQGPVEVLGEEWIVGLSRTSGARNGDGLWRPQAPSPGIEAFAASLNSFAASPQKVSDYIRRVLKNFEIDATKIPCAMC